MHPNFPDAKTLEPVMRNESIVLLAAASSLMFSIASASEKPNSTAPFAQSSRESLPALSPAQLRNPATDLEPTLKSSARMITWRVCSAPSSGSALSIYSLNGVAAHFLLASAMRDDAHSDLCADDDE
jgi:hypothetical protein